MDRPGLVAEHDRRAARVAGAFASAVALSFTYAVSGFDNSVPFPPTAIAERLVRKTPGDVATFFIELLGHWALRITTLGAVVLAIVLGMELFARIGRPRLSAAILGAASIVAALSSPTANPNPAGVIFVNGLAAALFSFVASSVYETRTLRDRVVDQGRRRVLRLGIGGAAGLTMAGSVVGWFAMKLQGPNTDVPLVAPEEPATIPERPPFPKIAGQTPEVTSPKDHYVVDINLIQPSVEAADWSLSVEGLIDSPTEYGFTDLQESFEVVQDYSVLTCISNEVGGNLVGHSAWGGVRLADVLEAAGIQEGAVDIVFRAADGYSDSIPLSVAMDPAVLLAVSQNGEPLSREHGFPCRVRIPAIYGMKNVKWVESIEVVDVDYKGYWMKRGWSDVAVVKTESRIDVAGRDGKASVGEEVWIAGVAWAGARGVSKVEVSTDGAKTWTEAELKEPINEVSWRLWGYRWAPDGAGDVLVACRATDGDGKVQTAEEADPHPSGASGYHFVKVEVS